MLDMVSQILGTPLSYIKKALIVPLSFLKICLTVATEEEGTHGIPVTVDALGTQVIDAIEGIEDTLTGRGITNGYT